jgi:hypothetical protein
VTTPTDMEEHLRALGGHARERLAARASEWEAVARGERTVEEVAAVRAEAGDSLEEIERAQALFRPLDAAEEEALVAALLAGRGGEAAEPGDAAGAEVIALADRKPAQGVTVPARETERGARWWWAGIAAAAAVLVVWLLLPDRTERQDPDHGDDAGLIALAPLPAYRLEIEGGLRPLRGDTGPEPDVPTYRGDSTFAWIMRPQLASEGEVEAWVLAQGEGGARSLPTEGRLELDEGGSARLSGKISSLGLAPGAWTIVFVVGRPSALPREPKDVLGRDGGKGWVALRQDILIEE